jgi:beta-ureidopropionase / N-carbamoyl-L-amino-acid hydrolase
MHRRQFASTLVGAAASLALARPLGAQSGVVRALSFATGARRSRWLAAPVIDAARLNARLAQLATFGQRADGGVDRVAYSAADLAARAWIEPLLRDAGLVVRRDAVGNLIARREGTDPSLRPIVIGSHIDTVPAGGRYDGTVGVLAAIEVADALRVSRTALRHPLEVAIWMNEEGGLIGSRIVAGELGDGDLEAVAVAGITHREGITRLGGDPTRLDSARWEPGRIAAYVELHIEQGASLDRDGLEIGVVEGIVGIYAWDVTITGQQNHAGATAMVDRKDALLAASRYVTAVDRLVRAEGQAVGTVGRLAVTPGARNVIPGRVDASLELRSLDEARIRRLFDTIQRETAQIGEANGTTFTFELAQSRGPSMCVPTIRDVVRTQARALGRTTNDVPSGAGHDAQSMARLGPMGMIFVPSVAGISHSPWELTHPHQITQGAEVLLQVVLDLDARPPAAG